ncbi:MAG: SDR family NAD(P)-dependent oxidoreductase [Cyclobacteriaceae bacterium]|nr:MAG: SDR family NAD(P)-dependent oxidoreductase [Cyclobacteriaceae bacterium]
MSKRIALITGATSGIGLATAHELAKHDFKLILCGRRKERLLCEQALLNKLTEVEILCFDIRDQHAVEKAFNALPQPWQKVDVLINNAGNAHGLDPIQKGDVRDWDAMIDINVKGLLYITKMVIPGMVERQSGHIVNLGSIAGKEVYPNGNVYSASKFAVDALTKGMRMDLNAHGIKVTAIHPGLVETEFSLVRFKGDEERASSVYKGFKPLSSQDIAEVIRYVLQQPEHVVLADITIFPTAQASSTMVKKNL